VVVLYLWSIDDDEVVSSSWRLAMADDVYSMREMPAYLDKLTAAANGILAEPGSAKLHALARALLASTAELRAQVAATLERWDRARTLPISAAGLKFPNRGLASQRMPAG
jgi:hypothetical protein